MSGTAGTMPTAPAMPGATPLMDRLIRRTVERHVPLSVHMDITYRCNERCVHCYLDHEDHGELTKDEVFRVLGELAESGTLLLTFSGGEIFLRKDLFEILERSRELGFDVSLKTNAILIHAMQARKLVELGVRRVQVSIYSADAAIHDSITKVRGSLERSLTAIRLLKAQGLQVKIACPLMKQNLSSYQEVVDLAAELGVPYVIDLTITPKMDGDREPLSLRATGAELFPILQERSCGGRASAEKAASSAESLGSAVSSSVESTAYDDLTCSAGHNSCYISPYGDVFPCVQMPVAAGNLRQKSFQEVWRGSSEMKRVRAIRESQLRVCSKCEIREFCERCPGLAMMEGGDLMGPYERACELAELHARNAGVANPVSAWHREQANRPAADSRRETASARSAEL